MTETDGDRFLILALSNCWGLPRCTKHLLARLGFRTRPKRQYRDYARFSKAAHKLIDDSIAYFEAPCVKLMEYLERGGFEGDHETYSPQG
jgi:hypothetical protein